MLAAEWEHPGYQTGQRDVRPWSPGVTPSPVGDTGHKTSCSARCQQQLSLCPHQGQLEKD